MYNVLTVNGIITTKHVRPFEEEFPGLLLIKKNSNAETENNETVNSDRSESDYIDYSLKEDSGTDFSKGSDSARGEYMHGGLSALTHVPEVPSKHHVDETDSESSSDSDQ